MHPDLCYVNASMLEKVARDINQASVALILMIERQRVKETRCCHLSLAFNKSSGMRYKVEVIFRQDRFKLIQKRSEVLINSVIIDVFKGIFPLYFFIFTKKGGT